MAKFALAGPPHQLSSLPGTACGLLQTARARQLGVRRQGRALSGVSRCNGLIRCACSGRCPAHGMRLKARRAPCAVFWGAAVHGPCGVWAHETPYTFAGPSPFRGSLQTACRCNRWKTRATLPASASSQALHSGTEMPFKGGDVHPIASQLGRVTSDLHLRQLNNDAVQRGLHLDLAAQSAVRARLRHALEHEGLRL